MPVHFSPGQSQPVQPAESAKAQEEAADSQGIISSASADRESSPRSHPLRQRRTAAVRPLPLTRWQKLSLVIRLGIKPPPIKMEDRKLHLDCSKDDYQAELQKSLVQYRTTHAPARYQPESPDKESEKAWLMYQAARDNHLGLLVLGKSDIRTDADMVTNFGYTSVHGTEAGRPDQLAWEGTQRRRTARRQPDEHHNETLGPGSILCDKGWSPMLNDAFLLGGIHGDNQFELALPFDREESGKDIASYLDENPNWLWPEGQPFPAILMRELIGLKLAGYKPHMSEAGLAFVCTKPQSAKEINHEHYLKELNLILQNRQQALMTLKDFLGDITQVA